MRIASGIISLILGLLVFLQSCTVSIGGSVIGEESAAQGGSVGILVAILFVIGGAFAFALPKVAMVVMVLAGIFGIAAGATTTYADIRIWGFIAIALAIMNYFGSRKPRDKQL